MDVILSESVPSETTMRVIILLTLLGTALAAPKSVYRIVGGETTTIDNYPYMVNVQTSYWAGQWFQTCGGSLVTLASIVTAANCFPGEVVSPSSWRAKVGTSFALTGGIDIPVSQIIMHEAYNILYQDSDVAIMKLAFPATPSDIIQTIPIAGTTYNVADGADVVTMGWGLLWSGPSGASPAQLQHVTVNIINQELCAERYAYLKTLPGYEHWPDITPGMLCAGILDVGGKDACQGDSGGPLSYKDPQHGDVLVGIVSWGFGCGEELYPGVYARVSDYSQWIVSNA